MRYRHERQIPETKECEKAEKQLLFQANALAQVSDAIVGVDNKWRVTYWNAAAEKQYGLTASEAIGLPLHEVCELIWHTPEDEKKASDAFAKGDYWRGENIHRKRNGEEIYVDVSLSALKDADGNHIGALVVIRDITERKRAEDKFCKTRNELQTQVVQQTKELRHALKDINESRRQVLDILESITDGFFAIDSLWRFTYINSRAQQLLGLRKEDVLFQKIWEKLPNTQVLRLYKELNNAAKQQTAVSFEEFFPSLDKWLEFHVYPYEHGISVYFSDFTERKQMEEALRESGQRVRRKLDSILSPEEDIENLQLSDIIDAPALQSLVDDLYKLAKLPIGIIDLKGKVLVGVGWQDICTRFHRVHPDTCRHCMESDLELTIGIPAGEFKLYRCKNGMWDAATPIIVGGKHMGNIFWGQFFFDDEQLDREFFRAQARRYGFDEEEYLAALEKVPRISREFLDAGMAFYLRLADMISKLSYSNIKLTRSLAERDALTASLRESEELLRAVSEGTDDAIFVKDRANRWLMANPATLRIVGKTAEETIGNKDDEIFSDPEIGRAILETDRRIMESGQAEVVEERIQTPQGYRVFLSTKAPRFDAEGHVIGLIGVSRDITDRKRAEEDREQLIERLETIHELTSIATSSLDIAEISERVIHSLGERFGLSQATIFVVAEDREELVPTASFGYPLGLRKATPHIRTDSDFEVARVFRSGIPKIVENIDDAASLSESTQRARKTLEELIGMPLKSCIILPLVAYQKTIGVMNIAWPIDRTFSQEDIDFFTLLSNELAVGLENARLYEAERRVADTLQEALLAIPERIEGMEYGYLYRSATEETKVGGDFFDIFELEHDRVGIIVGDVSGKGLQAASITSLVRNTIRAYAYEVESPAAILSKTNNAVKKGTPASYFITLFFGILDMKSGVITYCSAGHPPALLKKRATGTMQLDVSSPMIGAFAGFTYIEDRVTIEDGDILVLYTDGITEARCDGGFFGDERLVSFLETLQVASAKDAPHAIFDEVMRCTGGELSDDVVLLCLSLKR